MKRTGSIRINPLPKKRLLPKGWTKALRRKVGRFFRHVTMIEILVVVAIIVVIAGAIILNSQDSYSSFTSPGIATEGCPFGQAMEISDYQEGSPSTITVLGADQKKTQFFVHVSSPYKEDFSSPYKEKQIVCLVFSNFNPGLVYIFPREE